MTLSVVAHHLEEQFDECASNLDVHGTTAHAHHDRKLSGGRLVEQDLSTLVDERNLILRVVDQFRLDCCNKFFQG